MNTVFQKGIEKCQQYLNEIDEQKDKIVIYLDDDRIWLEIIERKCKGDQHVITISNTKEFKSFIHKNGCSKMFVDITIQSGWGINLQAFGFGGGGSKNKTVTLAL